MQPWEQHTLFKVGHGVGLPRTKCKGPARGAFYWKDGELNNNNFMLALVE